MNFDTAYGQNVGSALIDHKIVCYFRQTLKSLDIDRDKKKKRRTPLSFVLILFQKTILSILITFIDKIFA